jgi:hypothetical protein
MLSLFSASNGTLQKCTYYLRHACLFVRRHTTHTPLAIFHQIRHWKVVWCTRIPNLVKFWQQQWNVTRPLASMSACISRVNKLRTYQSKTVSNKLCGQTNTESMYHVQYRFFCQCFGYQEKQNQRPHVDVTGIHTTLFTGLLYQWLGFSKWHLRV